MPTYEFDLSDADPEVIREYQKINHAISNFCDEHPNQLTESEHQILREMLRERAKVLTKLFGRKVYSVCE